MIRSALPALDRPGATLLCVGAHSDDLELGAGGTVVRLLREHPALHVVWVVLSGTTERGDEARRSAAHLLAAVSSTVQVSDHPDGFLPTRWAEVKRDLEALKPTGPDLVLAPRRDDLHQDHRMVGELVWQTFRDHVVWEYEIAKYEGDLGQPNLFVTLDEADCEAKLANLERSFPSQAHRRWFDPALFRAVLRLRGLECNSPSGMAEAFTCRKLVV